ncbi:MAG TPA: hypothetical protein PLL88_04340 [Anaerolineaceae bacterium]|nr:hypothetical protein [Anaerolineaceae bacterium]
MNDFIALTCPSCGGQLQVQNNLQKCHCTHCGTQLLLKQDDSGMLIPLQARDLQASAKLKEMQFSEKAMDLLKGQIAELEDRFAKIRNAFLTDVIALRTARCFKDYEKENFITPGINKFCVLNWDNWFNPAWDIMGYTSVDDFLTLYAFMQQPKYQKDKVLLPLQKLFEPLPTLAGELKAKKARLNAMLEQAVQNQ